MDNRTFTIKRQLATFVACIMLLCSVLAFASCGVLGTKLSSISATYNGEDIVVGGTINKRDVSVTAFYTDNTRKGIFNFDLGEFDSSSEGTKTVTVSYTEDGVTKTATITVNVVQAPSGDTGTGDNSGNTNDNTGNTGDNTGGNNGDNNGGNNGSNNSGDNTGGNSGDNTGNNSGDNTGGNTGGNTGSGTVADMSIHFMMLGNGSTGDSIYIKAGDTDILIDAGSTSSSATTIQSYVNEYCTDGILEYVIVTHADTDHIAAFTRSLSSGGGIFEMYECETIIQFARTKQTTATYKTYCERRDAEVAAGAKCYTALECYREQNGAQRVYELADGITMEILYQKYYEQDTSNENDYSVCIMFTQGDNHYLFLGDLEEAGEKSLVASNNLPEVELYKAGHHGSKTSANEVLLEVIKPKVVCVSCCAGSTQYTTTKENTFPTQDFINRIAPYTDQVYVTMMSKNGSYAAANVEPMNGNIVYSCIDGEISVNCSNNNTVLKDTDWFKNNRTCPDAWKDDE